MQKFVPQRTRVGLNVTGRGIIREGATVYLGDRQIGIVTSGTHCPYLGRAVAMALIESDCSAVGTSVEADVRGRRVAAEIVELPFFRL